jgi:hypothetical protein
MDEDFQFFILSAFDSKKTISFYQIISRKFVLDFRGAVPAEIIPFEPAG